MGADGKDMVVVGAVAGARVASLADPTRRVTGGWIGAFALAWLGVWMAQLTPVQLLLPAQVDELLGHPDSWVRSVVAFGVVSGLSGVAAFVAYPLAGGLSDRTTSRFGRRRPWIAGGALVFAVALALLGRQTTLVGVTLCWVVAMTAFCALTAALTATISDQVPHDQRGTVSGWLAAPQAVGTILGLLLVLYLVTGRALGYAALGALLVLLAVPFLLRPDPVLAREHRAPLTLAALRESLWIDPRRNADFAWTLTGRVLGNLANALGTTLLLYFLMFELHDADAEDDLVLLTLIYLVLLVASALGAGALSDRLGRRRGLLVASCLLLVVAALLLALVPSLPVAMVSAGILGAGYGTFLAVGQALATDVLPDPAARGKDLGIMNVALAVPQAVAPLLGALLVAAAGGFRPLFLLAAACAAGGAVALGRVRGVR